MNNINGKTVKKYISIFICILLLGYIVLTNFANVTYAQDEFYNGFITKTIQNICGFIFVLIIARYLNIKLFFHIQKPLYIIPCLFIAINNMQWFALINGKMEIIHNGFVDYFLFSIYCLSIGLFEEIIFRGILFSSLLGIFPKNKKGLTYSCIVSSAIFGVVHIFNGISVSTLLQILYSTLTGALFVFSYIRTKNILIPVLLHSVYNFCGMLFSINGLGSGVCFDLGTIILMLVIDVAVGFFLLIDYIKKSVCFFKL